MPKNAEIAASLNKVADAFADKKCYDCGSPYPHRHTELCDLAPKGAARDLPATPGTQHWTGSDDNPTQRDSWYTNLVEQCGFCDVAEAFELGEGDGDGVLGALADMGHEV